MKCSSDFFPESSIFFRAKSLAGSLKEGPATAPASFHVEQGKKLQYVMAISFETGLMLVLILLAAVSGGPISNDDCNKDGIKTPKLQSPPQEKESGLCDNTKHDSNSQKEADRIEAFELSRMLEGVNIGYPDYEQGSNKENDVTESLTQKHGSPNENTKHDQNFGEKNNKKIADELVEKLKETESYVR